MDYLKLKKDPVALDGDLVKFLMRLADHFGTPTELLAAIDAQLGDAADTSTFVGQLMTELGLDPKRIEAFLKENDRELDWIFGTVGELAGRSISWSLKKSAANSGKTAVQASAELAATLEVDADGELLDQGDQELVDGAIRYDPKTRVYLELGLEGTLKGQAKFSGKLDQVGAEAAFAAESELRLENLFGHHPAERVLPALWRDVNAFALPGQVDRASVLLPDQYVHLRGRGSVQVGARLGWSAGWVSQVRVAEKSLDVAETLDVKAAVEASVSFSYLLSGYSDILISRSPDQAPGGNLVRVALAVGKTSEQQVGWGIGASVGIEGVDRMGQAVVATFAPQLDALIATFEKEADEYSNLKKLFTREVDEELDKLLTEETVTTEIEKWLRLIGKDVDLSAKLEELVHEVLDKVVGGVFDNLQKPTDEAIQAIRDLIKKYQAVLKRVDAVLKKAAHLKIGIDYARKRQRVESDEVWLSFDLDPAQEPEIFRSMIFGDFAEALRVAREEPDRVHRAEGLLEESGSLDIESTLSITALGMGITARNLFQQKWKTEVSLNGDIVIGVETGFEHRFSTWRKLRAAAFLADTRLVAQVADAPALQSVEVSTKVSLELSYDLKKPKVEAVDHLEEHLQRLEVLTGPTHMVKKLAIEGLKKRQFGSLLTSSVVLELDAAMIDSILYTSRSLALRTFATNLLNLAAPRQLRIFDVGTGDPILTWPGVAEYLAGPDKFAGSRDFIDSTGKRTTVTPGQIEMLRRNRRILQEFTKSLDRLERLRDLDLNGASREVALARIRAAQRDLLNASKHLVGAAAGGPKLGDALFRTFYELLSPLYPDLDPFVVVERKADEKIFVFG